jgi:glutaredoxin-related protein
VQELASEGAPLPRLFVMGHYVGGGEDCGLLAESGKLRERAWR